MKIGMVYYVYRLCVILVGKFGLTHIIFALKAKLRYRLGLWSLLSIGARSGLRRADAITVVLVQTHSKCEHSDHNFKSFSQPNK
eukprot:COSAG02_NODE_8125_length_2697_cov_181.379113_3_plen_84_part_00